MKLWGGGTHNQHRVVQRVLENSTDILQYVKGFPRTSHHFEMYTYFHTHCEMAVKSLMYKSWLLCAYSTRTLKRYSKGLGKAASYLYTGGFCIYLGI